VVAGDRGVPDHRVDERPHRGHEPADQAGQTRRLWVPEPGQLPPPGTVALHPAQPPIVSEEPDGARLKSKSRAINKLKAHRAVATRYDKRDYTFRGTIDLASIRIWLRDPVR
jgi:transposase